MNFQDWPGWGPPFVWTLITLGISWLMGRVVASLVVSRAPRWLAGRHTVVAECAARIVHRRMPWWFLLVGVWIAAGYWPLSPEVRILVDRSVFVLGALSITLAAAAVASQTVEVYGALIAPALPVSSLTRNVAWGLTAVTGLLVVLHGVGLSITPMLTALGVGGLAVALALQEPLANFFAGLFITLAGQIRVGDYVKLDTGQEGYVVDFSWRSTRLRMLANNLVLVPNAKLAQAVVINHHLPSADLAVLVEVGVDYSVNFTVILRAREFVDQYLIKHEFVKRLHTRFNEERIVIPFPIRALTQRPEPPQTDDAIERTAGAA
jgi:small-conductance mechanosensitive channel